MSGHCSYQSFKLFALFLIKLISSQEDTGTQLIRQSANNTGGKKTAHNT